MIKSIKHKKLKKYWTQGISKGLHADWINRIDMIMDSIDAVTNPQALKQPGFHFHELQGDRKGTYSIRLTGNYRITFEWDDNAATNIDIEDYH